MPKDVEADIATEAVDAAVGLQSSMEKTIKEVLPEAKHLKLAVGVDLDKVITPLKIWTSATENVGRELSIPAMDTAVLDRLMGMSDEELNLA